MDIGRMLGRGGSKSSASSDEGIKEGRHGLHKRRSVATTVTNDQKRVLRQLKEEELRKNKRDAKVEKNRRMMEEGEEENEENQEGQNMTGQAVAENSKAAKGGIDRRTKLEEWRLQKKKLEEDKRKKAKPVFKPGGGAYKDAGKIGRGGATSPFGNTTLTTTRNITGTLKRAPSAMNLSRAPSSLNLYKSSTMNLSRVSSRANLNKIGTPNNKAVTGKKALLNSAVQNKKLDVNKKVVAAEKTVEGTLRRSSRSRKAPEVLAGPGGSTRAKRRVEGGGQASSASSKSSESSTSSISQESAPVPATTKQASAGPSFAPEGFAFSLNIQPPQSDDVVKDVSTPKEGEIMKPRDFGFSSIQSTDAINEVEEEIPMEDEVFREEDEDEMEESENKQDQTEEEIEKEIKRSVRKNKAAKRLEKVLFPGYNPVSVDSQDSNMSNDEISFKPTEAKLTPIGRRGNKKASLLEVPRASPENMDEEPAVETEVDEQAETKTPARGRRRSRRPSGVQPDPTLSKDELARTPARRAKDRSLSCDRRKQCFDCQLLTCNGQCKQQPTPVVARPSTLPALPESPQSNSREASPALKPSETPGVITRRRSMRPLVPSTADTGSTSSEPSPPEKQVAATPLLAAKASNELLTPASSLAAIFSAASLKSNAKPAQENRSGAPTNFKTPSSKKDAAESMVISSPLSAVTKSRGRSSKRKSSTRLTQSEGKRPAPLSDLFDDLESSPLLERLEKKCQSKEAITEEDFAAEEEIMGNKMVVMGNKVPKLTEDWCEDVVKELDKENQGEEAMEEERKEANTEETPVEHGSVPYFRKLLITETDRITKICNEWEEKLSANAHLIDEEIQFSGLVDNCEFGKGEKETTTMDLTGFWEMIYIQVEDVDAKFVKLSKVEDDGWVDKEVKVVKKVQKKKVLPAAKPRTKSAASSGLRALIAAKRKASEAVASEEEMSAVKVKKNEEQQAKSDVPKVVAEDDDDKEAEKEFDGGFFSVKSPVQKPKSPATSPKSPLATRSPNTPSRSPASAGITKSTGGDRLRRSVLTDSTKRRLSGLVSPFISAIARRSVGGDEVSKRSGLLFDGLESPRPISSPGRTYGKASPRSEASAAEEAFDKLVEHEEKMEEDAAEQVMKVPEVVVNTRVVEVLDNEASPGLRRSRGRVSLMPMTEVAVAPNSPKADLMSFASPVSSSATLSPRRSTRRSVVKELKN